MREHANEVNGLPGNLLKMRMDAGVAEASTGARDWTVTTDVWHQLVGHAQESLPKECVGLLAGTDQNATVVFRLENEAQRETEFRAGVGLFAPFREMRRKELQLSAIYHSHPSGLAVPSQKDRDQNLYPHTPQLIISLAGKTPSARLWLYDKQTIQELPWKIEPVGER